MSIELRCKECEKPKIHARGLCYAHYMKAYRRGERATNNWRSDRKQQPTCHPDRKLHSKEDGGLCGPCYRKKHYDPIKAKAANDAYPKEKRRAAFSRWLRNNPEKNVNRVRRYRATKRNAKCDFTNTQWLEMLAKANGCHYCGQVVKLTQDHKIPISRGGEHTASNIVPACMTCNGKKGAMTYDEFLSRKELVGACQ